ncbi:MAG: UMP kinase [Pseudomonadota bacterium]|nr:UMP kinase [Pseudomonadota bacterium]
MVDGASGQSGRQPVYKRVLLKVSGEALMAESGFGIDPKVTARIARDIRSATEMGVVVGVVIGGGNIFRGVSLAAKGADRVMADHMGMLATVMNALAMRMALEAEGVPSVVLNALNMPQISETFSQRRLEDHLAEGKVVVFAGGTGNPFFTTDTAAALRASEMRCDALFKGTQVDGIYSKDPREHADAVRHDRLTHSDVLEKGLAVMDAAAVSLARDAGITVVVFSIHQEGEFARILQGEGRCTTVSA